MKKINKLSYLILAVIFCFSCKSTPHLIIQKSNNGLTVLSDSIQTQIEILDDGIIHVVKSPINKPEYKAPNLVSVLENKNVDWVFRQSKNKIIIKTDELKVIFNKNGEIEYYNDKGKHLVSETNELTYLDLDKTEGCVVSQAFTNGNEAIYGLGQFQSGIMNWKNVPVSLIQSNQEACVPFILSTKNYGILWNNYSVTHFNPAQKEIDFNKIDIDKAQNQTENTNGEAEDVANTKFKKDSKSNIRTTTFTPTKTGIYTFYVESDIVHKIRGKVQVSFDGDVIINYTTVWMPKNYSGKKYLEAGKQYEVAFENTGAKIEGRLLYNEPDYNKTVFSSEAASNIDYYLIAGDNPAEVLELNHKLTGQTPLLNKKSYGLWQCRERYNTQEELLENANEMRQRKIPFDMIVQDWFYWPKGTKGPQWDRERYPSPWAMSEELKDLNLEIMVSVWPSVNNDPLLANYNLTDSKLGNTAYLDFWNYKVGQGFYNILSDSMFHYGINSIWLDGSEPTNEPAPNFMTGAGEYKYLANTYSLAVSKAVYEGRRNEYPDQRVVNLTRSAFSGQQRYGVVTWSGDTEASWEQLREQISAGLNFTMSGIPYWTHDIGGFFRDSKSMNPIFDDQYTNPEYKELLTRWFQFGTFCPIFRIHGYKSNTEIWRYGQRFEDIARKFIDLRYQLLPYIYSEAWKVTKKGHSIMSPLAYYYPNDKNTWEIDDQFFFGKNLMVAVVTEYGQEQKQVYLPKGEWYNFWTEELMQGSGNITVSTPIDELPLFVKAGSILPKGPKVQYATETTNEPTIIKIYPGQDAKYTMYFDDNSSYDYERGHYSEIEFSYNNRAKELEIEKGNGKLIDYKKESKEFIIEMIGNPTTHKVTFKGKDIKVKF